MENFYIQTCDNFFPALVRKQIIADYLNYGCKFNYLPGVTYNKSPEMRECKESWERDNTNIVDTEAFSCQINNESLNYDILEKNLKAFIQNKFGIPVKQIIRIMLVYIPPNPTYDSSSVLGPHVDITNGNHLNLLYYLFDNDADTIFFDKIHDFNTTPKSHEFHKVNVYKRVQVKENRAVLFNGLIYHAGNVSKYSKRVTLNVNFLPEIAQNS